MDTPQTIALTCLVPHPQNPRFAPRQEVVDQIATQLDQTGAFDPAHALIVRVLEGDTYQIIAGHHRVLAATQAGFTAVPCWVREMNDEEAYMALVLDNAQSELLPLEEGMHALGSGKKLTEYAQHVGKEIATCQHRWQAARVASQIIHMDKITLAPVWRALDAVHVAPEWLWEELVVKVIDDTLTVEKTRELVRPLKHLAAPPEWADRLELAALVVRETIRPKEICDFATTADACVKRLQQGKEDTERLTALLYERLASAQPAYVSDVIGVCNDIEEEQRALIKERQQKDAFRTQRDEQVRARTARLRQAVSLTEWETLAPDEKDALLHLSTQDVRVGQFNEQENEAIEWAMRSYNPVTGCKHDCPYCLDPATPILMADLTWRPLGDLVVGDEICGMLPPGRPPCTCFGTAAAPALPHLVNARVQAVMHRKLPAVALAIAGASIVGSRNHRWLTIHREAREMSWICARHLSVDQSYLATVNPAHLRSQALPDFTPLGAQAVNACHDWLATQAQALIPKDHRAYLVEAIEPLAGKHWLTDITTTTGNFITVGGVISHNCYARDKAENPRFEKIYPFGFAPTLHPARLLIPRTQALPTEAATDARYKNVFTCSMADLFGRWVPQEWIDAVFAAMAEAPWWNFLCLTKFPKRLVECTIPPNAWMGTTVDLQARVKAAEDAFAHITTGVRWLSIEPLLEPLRFTHLERFQWMVIGGASRSSKTPEWRPPHAWIKDLERQADDAGVKVYYKTNLLGKRRLELPFDGVLPNDSEGADPVFHYLKIPGQANGLE